MANGFDPEAKYAQLGERVDNQSRQIGDLDNRMGKGFSEIASQIRGLVDDIRGGSKTQWPIIIGFCSVTITVLGGLGFMALQPIKDNIATIREDSRLSRSETKDSLAAVVAAMVTQKEMEWRTARGQEDRQRTETAIKDIRDNLVPRAEHERVWQNYSNKDDDLQRQVEEVKQALGGIYGTRDALLDIRSRLDRVERERTGQP